MRITYTTNYDIRFGPGKLGGSVEVDNPNAEYTVRESPRPGEGVWIVPGTEAEPEPEVQSRGPR